MGVMEVVVAVAGAVDAEVLAMIVTAEPAECK